MPQYKPVKALQKGMSLLDYLAQHPDGCELNELADHLSCSVPAAFHIVQTMVAADYVRREEKPVRYFLGKALLRLSAGVEEDAFHQGVQDLMYAIHKALSGASVFYCAFQGGHVQIQKNITKDGGSVLQENLNTMLPPYTSVGSLVHLAFWSDEERQHYFDTYAFETYGSALWGDYSSLLKAIKQTQKNRIVFLPSRDKSHIRAGVPLYNADGIFTASFTVQWNQRDVKVVKKKKQQLTDTVFKLLAAHGVD